MPLPWLVSAVQLLAETLQIYTLLLPWCIAVCAKAQQLGTPILCGCPFLVKSVLLRRLQAARPVLGHEIDPVLGFEKKAGFATDCYAPAMVC